MAGSIKSLELANSLALRLPTSRLGGRWKDLGFALAHESALRTLGGSGYSAEHRCIFRPVRTAIIYVILKQFTEIEFLMNTSSKPLY